MRLHRQWTMAYAAGVGDAWPRWYDTTRSPLPVHPLFPVSAEWVSLMQTVSAEAWGPEIGALGVHAGLDLQLFGPLHADTDVEIGATVAGVEQIQPGALATLRFDGADLGGGPLWTSWTTSIFRGVTVSGPDRPPSPPPAPSRLAGGAAREVTPLVIGPLDAQVYSACSRIWNPVHTDATHARRSGLPALLHGTATAAKCVSTIAGERGPSVTRVRARFVGPVLVESVCTIVVTARAEDEVRFEVEGPDGQRVLSDGLVAFDVSY